MSHWLIENIPNLTKLFLSIVLIFLIIIIITRIAGLRTFAKMSSFDFASTIAIGSILATVIMNNGKSILEGAVAIGGIILLQGLFSLLVRKSKIFKKVFTNSPILLMKGNTILYKNLSKTNVSEGDLMAKLREANVINFNEVIAVVFETTGDISVLHSSEKKDVESKLLEGVKE